VEESTPTTISQHDHVRFRYRYIQASLELLRQTRV